MKRQIAAFALGVLIASVFGAECPVDENGQEIIYTPDPKNCTNYYVCTNGEQIHTFCSDGLHWNTATLQCDYPENAKCQIKECPRDENGQEIIFHPDPLDCTRFYICSGGEFVHMTCPDGMHWNTSWNACDWPEQANCTEETNI